MFCPGCGNPHEPAAQFCAICGTRLGAPPPAAYAVSASSGAAVAPAFAPAPAATSAVAAPSYVWGNIQGWGMLVGGPLFFLLFLFVYFAPDSDHDQKLGSAILMAASAVATIVGLAIVRRTKLAMIAMYVIAGLHVLLVPLFLLALLAPQHPAETMAFIFAALLGVAFWAACAAYYYRRREFLH